MSSDATSAEGSSRTGEAEAARSGGCCGAVKRAGSGASADVDAGGVVGRGRRGRAAASVDRDGPGTGAAGAT